jgi:hypothetical protein
MRVFATVCILIVLPLIYYGWGFPFKKLFFMVESGKIAERVYTADAFRSRRLPLWNPYFDSGHPHAACLQPASWYPPNLLYIVLDPGAATNAIALLHYAMAGIFTLLFVRAIGLPLLAAIFSAICFMFCGYLTARLPFPDILDSSIWLPLALYFTHRIVKGGGIGCIAGLALSLCLQIFGGHVGPVLYTVTVCGAYVIYFAAVDRKKRGGWGKPVAAFAAAAGLGLCLAAVQILPLHEVSALSVKRGIDYAEFTSWSLHPLLLVGLLFPYAFGSNAPGFYQGWYWGPWNYFETSCYAGILPMCLALLAWLTLRRTEQQVRFWGVVAVTAIFLALGRYNPLYRIVYYLPVYNVFRAPARHCLEFSFAVAVLAGFGLRHIMIARDARARRTLKGIAIGLVLITVFSVGGIALLRAVLTRGFAPVFGWMSAFSREIVENVKLSNNAFAVPFFLMLATAAALMLLRFYPRSRPVFALLFALLFVDLFSCGSFYWRHAVSGERMIEERRNFLAPAFQAMRARGGDPAGYRVCSFLRSEDDMHDLGIVHERFGPFKSVNGFGMMLSRDYAEMLGTDIWGDTSEALYRNNRVLSMLGVRYVIARPTDGPFLRGVRDPAGRSCYVEIACAGGAALFENVNAMPRAWCAERAIAVDDFERARSLLWSAEGGPDLAREAIVEGAAGSWGSGAARIAGEAPGRVEVRCESPGGCFLVLSERYFPGWLASVDGAPARLLRTNGILRGVAVPPGARLVTFEYRPRSLLLGAWVSIAACVGICALAIAGRIMRPLRRRRG